MMYSGKENVDMGRLPMYAYRDDELNTLPDAGTIPTSNLDSYSIAETDCLRQIPYVDSEHLVQGS